MSTSSYTSVSDVFRALKHHPKGCCKLGTDGVLRGFDDKRNVIDAIGLSPALIKELLDRQEWSREIEDKFRGVDGTKVVDRKQLYEPDEESKPPNHTEEEKKKIAEQIKVHNEKLMKRMKQDEKDGVDMSKYSCTRVRSDYQLGPK
ncbi:uncharacterized protein PAC_08027 [Phialocephala subalpina]|uniref:Uncharacterized protein n=1 Tax=Phialocephala subalpina TaxID=576137 RepID=A0A1L7WZD7_9HELO|nr:uncharacterized protein PAC_08027 [Phialocephala subalpina]